MGCGSSKVQSVGELPQGVEQMQRSPAEAEAAAKVLVDSFAGTANSDPELGFDWCLGPDLAGKGWDDPRRHRSMSWIFRFIVEETFAVGNKGAVLVCRTDSGAIGGAAVLRIHRAKPSNGMAQQVIAYWRGPSPCTEAKSYTFGNPRMDAFTATLKRLHDTHAAGPHLYVYAVGVDPAAQGQGFGGKLMRAATAIADKEGLPCYLETCGPTNPKIYAKYGFAVVGQEEMATKPKKGAEVEVFEHPYVAMVRPATSS